jgi:hypothetical protein
VKAQNWTAIAIDFVIVVTGVFIGIEVSNWNAARAEAAQQEVYLERLRDDFGGVRARVERHLEHYETAIAGADYILTLIDADGGEVAASTVDRARLERGLNALTAPRIPPAAPATYVEMVSEGQLSGVRPPALRDKLAEHDRLLSIVQEVSRTVTDRSIELTPILYRHVNARATLDGESLSGIRLQLVAFDLDGMRQDRDFAIAVTLLREDVLNSLGQRKFQIALIDEIIAMIDKERAR